MSCDFDDLLKLFNAKSVKYLIAGGHAVMLYSEPRYTRDLGICVEASEENAAKVFQALVEFGAPLSGLTAEDFAREGFFYQIRLSPSRVDILMSIDGVKFDDAWPRRQKAPIGGHEAWFIGREDLIANKRSSGRHIDLHDIGLLE